jgi:hypothetical protein
VNSTRIFVIGAVLLGIAMLLPSYERLIETMAAAAFVVMIAFGFALQPRRDVFYVRTLMQSVDTERNLLVEHDLLAVKVESARLWLLFLPTSLAVAFLVVTAAQGALWKSGLLNQIFQTAPWLVMLCRLPAYLIGAALWIWVSERRVLRDADACSATSVGIKGGRVSFMFKDSRGGYGGGDDFYFGLVRPPALAKLVFYSVQKPELNKIGMGLLFHRPTILGRGLTDLDRQTVAAHSFSGENAS